MPKKPAVALRVRTGFAVPGDPRNFHRGKLVSSADPVVKGREHLFESVDETLGIEQATANPGQKRAAKKEED